MDKRYFEKTACSGDDIFFVTDKDSLFGTIDIRSGKINLLTNIPAELVGHIYYGIISPTDNGFVALSHDGNHIVKYDKQHKNFQHIVFKEGSKDMIPKSWAGACQIGDRILFLSRDSGEALAYDNVHGEICDFKYDSDTRISWALGYKGQLFVLDWNGEILSIFNGDGIKTSVIKTGLELSKNRKSNSSIPTHGISYYDEFIYIHDVQNILSINTDSGEYKPIFHSKNKDIGNRIVPLDKYIIIPPWTEGVFLIIHRNAGEIYKSVNVPEGILSGKRQSSLTGLPCETKDYVCYPLLGENKIARIDKKTLEFDWVDLTFDDRDFAQIEINRIKHWKILMETDDTSLSYLLSSLAQSS